MRTADIEIAVASHFDYRRNLVVPNISWGMGLHECDLLVLTQAGCAYEVEIKISKADLIKDRDKSHGHHSRKIKYLYFAIPLKLLEFQEHIPERAGIITVERIRGRWRGNDREWDQCKVARKPRPNGSYKFSDAERLKVAHLGAMRIWGLKKKLQQK